MPDRPSTPPARTSEPGTIPRGPITPEQVRRLEESRLKAKALRNDPSNAAGQKRPYSSISRSNVPASNRDASSASTSGAGAGVTQLGNAEIRPAKKFEKYIEYDFSTMEDTKGGFLSQTDDPHNRALNSNQGGLKEEKPPHMTLAEWERHVLIRNLKQNKRGPFEPGISVMKEDAKKCRECGSLEIDWKWEEIFGCRVCNSCKEKLPDKYSLLTKTEAREDYLLTDPELKDEELFPRMERPNPHKSTYASMQLFLRYQIEEYAFSSKKWGSGEALDAEFERRESDKKKRKDAKFRAKLADLKKRTRFEAHRRIRENKDTGAGIGDKARFDERIESGKHVHEWGRSLKDPETGMSKKRCTECGMEVEELEL